RFLPRLKTRVSSRNFYEISRSFLQLFTVRRSFSDECMAAYFADRSVVTIATIFLMWYESKH
ncbi:hypothetical protein, partial [Duodenibacillus massiliensis]|uniref:hypothetical protein n=1 Tax=Duodenibacillus massiliensis TaxID=1852381 RepID=UPI00307AD1BC